MKSAALNRRSAVASASRRSNAATTSVSLFPYVITVFLACLIAPAIATIATARLFVPFICPNPLVLAPVDLGYAAGNPHFSAVLNSSTLLELAEFDAAEEALWDEIHLLLDGDFDKIVRSTAFSLWRGDSDTIYHHLSTLRRLHRLAHPLLLRWSLRRLNPNLRRRPPVETLSELLGLLGRREKYSSCAVVGNSGYRRYAGSLIDAHSAVIRLNKGGRIAGGDFTEHVGTNTTISFIDSDVLHDCARLRPDCSCHPHGSGVPVAIHIRQPVHFLDFARCNNTAAPFLLTDPVFDRWCAKIAKYYSLRRWLSGGGGLEGWSAAYGELFRHSSGMEAVVMAVGVCERVNLFGFGNRVKDHDYEAEFEFYRDLMDSPETIPFLSSSEGGVKFKFPRVMIYPSIAGFVT